MGVVLICSFLCVISPNFTLDATKDKKGPDMVFLSDFAQSCKDVSPLFLYTHFVSAKHESML